MIPCKRNNDICRLIFEESFLSVIPFAHSVPISFFCNALFVIQPALKAGSDIAHKSFLSFPVTSKALTFFPFLENECVILSNISPTGVVSETVASCSEKVLLHSAEIPALTFMSAIPFMHREILFAIPSSFSLKSVNKVFIWIVHRHFNSQDALLVVDFHVVIVNIMANFHTVMPSVDFGQ